jgi:Cyclic nucleotide-binding domain.
MIEHLKASYGNSFEPALIQDILQVGTFKEVPAGFKLMDIGQYVKGMPLLVSGAIKVLREDTDGDELLLYYLEQGDTCSMTMSCCMGQTKSEIRAITETDTKLIMIPIQKMEEWTSKYKTWRNFVFESYHNRLNEMYRL